MKNILNTPKKKIAAAVIAAVVIIGCIYLATTAAGAANSQSRGVGLEKSIAVALADAGLKQDQVQNLKGSFDQEDGLEVYDVYFEANGFEYEYTIKAADGTILESEIETPDGKIVTAEEARDIGLEKAKAAALSHAGVAEKDVTFTKSKKDSDDGRLVYEFEFVKGSTEYDYEVDAATGSILAFSKETVDSAENASGTQSAPSASGQGPSSAASSSTASSASGHPSSSYIGVDKAKSIALNHAGVKASAATFTKAKLDRNDGHYDYEIEFYAGGVEYEYEIDATSGKIREYDSEPMEDDDWDDHDEDHDDDHDDEWDD